MDKVTLDVTFDTFSIEVPNGLSEKQLYKKVHRQVMKAIAQDRVNYSWVSNP
tara:strand:+ start:424 stop:579 length:156 start_codon:yes stop_codon:yes gene_type:complete